MFQTVFKHAIIHPLLKKPNLDPHIAQGNFTSLMPCSREPYKAVEFKALMSSTHCEKCVAWKLVIHFLQEQKIHSFFFCRLIDCLLLLKIICALFGCSHGGPHLQMYKAGMFDIFRRWLNDCLYGETVIRASISLTAAPL